ALRSFSAKVDVPYEEIVESAKADNLRHYLIRTDQQVAAPVTVPPTALAVAEARSTSDGGLEIKRRQLELMRRKAEWDTPPVDLHRARLDLWERKMRMDADDLGLEHRSLPRATVTVTDRRGHLVEVAPGEEWKSYGR